MSRIGKLPIKVSEDVNVTIDGQNITVKGPKGELSLKIHNLVELVAIEGGFQVKPKKNTKLAKSLYGTTQRLVANMVEGVTKGFSKKLEINGVGYRAQLKGKDLELNVGFSHPVLITPPEGLTVNVDKNVIEISGIDKQAVGQLAANVRSIRPPEPYKGKGIKYSDEIIRRKAGKAAKTAA